MKQSISGKAVTVNGGRFIQAKINEFRSVAGAKSEVYRKFYDINSSFLTVARPSRVTRVQVHADELTDACLASLDLRRVQVEAKP